MSKLDLEKVLQDGGFYGENGCWNSIVKLPGDSHIYRARVETIVVRNRKEVYMKLKPDGEYFLPGGSCEKDVDDIVQAENECHEEARLNIRNIRYSSIKRIEHHNPPNWTKKTGAIKWNGSISKIYVAEYDSKYKGKIKKVDKDPFIASGRFYPIKDAFKYFDKEHSDALFHYLKDMKTENNDLSKMINTMIANEY